MGPQLGPATFTASALAQASAVCPIPALKPILAVAVLCLDAFNDVQKGNESARLLGRHVAEMTMVVVQEIQSSQEDIGPILPRNLLDALLELEACMVQVANSLQRINNLGRVKQLLQRSALTEEIRGLRNDLDLAWQAFRISMTINTTQELHRQAELQAARSEAVFDILAGKKQAAHGPAFAQLHASAETLFGRDAEVEQAVQVIGNNLQIGAKLVILGPGGVGKTSLARAVLLHPQVATMYGERRVFVSCESSVDSNSLLISIGMALGVSGNDLKVPVLQALSEQPALLVLDNFETPWESSDSLPSLALIVTLRGTERPLGVQWSSPPMPIVRSFDRAAALQTIYKVLPIAADADDKTSALHLLLDAVGDLPLAVTMIAALMQFESAEELLVRWQAERTSMLSLGGGDRLSSMDISVQISLNGPRLSSNSDGKDLLFIIALFPNGMSDAFFELFSSKLNRIRQTISLLKGSALIQTSTTATLSTHPLIREHILRHHSVPRHLLDALVAYCAELLSVTRKFRTEVEIVNKVVLPELNNLDFVLTFLLNLETPAAAALLQYIPTFASYSRRAITLAQRVQDIPVAVRLLAYQASVSADQTAAQQYAEEAVFISTNQKDPCVRATALKALAYLPSMLLQALHLLSGAEQTAETQEHRSGHRDDKHRSYLLEAERLAREIHYHSAASEVQALLADHALREGRYLMCEREAHRIYQDACETMNVAAQMRAQGLLFATTTRRGDHRRAIEYSRQAGLFWKQLGRTQQYVGQLIMQAEVMIRDRNLGPAEQLVRQALNIQDAANMKPAWPYKRSFITHARILIEIGDLDRAETCLRHSYTDAGGKHYQIKRTTASSWLNCTGSRKIRPSITHFIVGLIQWHEAGDIGETLERLVDYAKFSAITGDSQTSWNILSVILPFQLSSGAAWEAAQCLLAMVEVQVMSGTTLRLNPTELDPAARLRKAFQLFSANDCTSGVNYCYDLAQRLGIDWEPL
ncbi:hypothetical protein BKA62DRAFT_729917 [Auriculariales sp. MPI-PUGE-AT-0066]|nr:hypothetical protein BKA62DRAFT_729917 [Auriculariales sp. MPI-PUGE-AT-0066]